MLCNTNICSASVR